MVGIIDLQGVEADLARALPLSQIDLRGPAVGPVQPERRPGALRNGRHEVGLEVETATLLDRELLLRVDGAAVVLELAVARLGPGVVRLELQVGIVDDADLRLGHEGRPVVRVAPRVVVVEVGLKLRRRAEARVRDERGRSLLQLTLVERSRWRRGGEAGQEGDEDAGDHGRCLREANDLALVVVYHRIW